MVINRMVYVVDDGADYRFLLQQLFSRFLPELRVKFFASGDDLYQHVQDEVVDSVNQSRPGLILLDLNMPGLDGVQTLSLLKQQPDWKVVPIVMMSSESSGSEIKRCYNAGANSFLIKSTDFMVLKHVMTETCRYWLDLNQLAYN